MFSLGFDRMFNPAWVEGAFQEVLSGEGDFLGLIIQLVFISLFLFSILYGQRFQVWIMLRNLEVGLRKVKRMRDGARKIIVETLHSSAGRGGLESEVDRILQYFWIQPTSIDPYGIVGKIEHILNVREERFRWELRSLMPNIDEVQLRNLENLLEAGIALEQIYRIIRHYYLLGKKTMSLFIIYQVNAILPMILREAEALTAAVRAFRDSQPIGDGAGSLVAARFMYGAEKKVIAEDTVMSEVEFENRRLIVVKALGPGGNVGKPGEAVKRILESRGDISAIIIIDAALKLEGEKLGEVAEGVGAAIGGIGVDKFKIEEAAKMFNIPLYAIVIKESIYDAISPMRREIYAG
ncbi:MAG TPA: DUF1512 domain-containing protein, partial [Chromatiaceae bacterium]|nr:DUF1512 domain-containing protein [Chromatiaceae bacterium]